jgi:hypothetical protein
MRAYYEILIPCFLFISAWPYNSYIMLRISVRESLYISSQSGVTPAESVTEMIYIIKYNNKFLTELAQGCYNVLYLRKVAGRTD